MTEHDYQFAERLGRAVVTVLVRVAPCLLMVVGGVAVFGVLVPPRPLGGIDPVGTVLMLICASATAVLGGVLAHVAGDEES